jgi:RNA polymerase sigma-32 factor
MVAGARRELHVAQTPGGGMRTVGRRMTDISYEVASMDTEDTPASTARSNADSLVTRYMAEVNRCPLLSRDQENELARQYKTTGEMKYAHRLLNANLKFVVKIAHEFRGYHVPLLDLVQEGNLGLMVAVKKFDPTRGYRLISYGVWWIRAYMRAYALKSWSLVRVGTTQAQRKLFFSLRTARRRAEAAAGPGRVIASTDLARQLNVKETELTEMAIRLAGRDVPLEARIGDDGKQTHIDRLPTPVPGPEEAVAAKEAAHLVHKSVRNLVPTISVKQRYVLDHRVLADGGRTLQDIGNSLNISRERVRQIEGVLLDKMGQSLRKMSADHAV